MPQSDVPFLRTFYVLSGLTILGPLAFETFLPALEDAAKDLNTEASTLLITIAMMQVGTASGQIIYGPLSDRFGRRPVILGGMYLYYLHFSHHSSPVRNHYIYYVYSRVSRSPQQ